MNYLLVLFCLAFCIIYPVAGKGRTRKLRALMEEDDTDRYRKIVQYYHIFDALLYFAFVIILLSTFFPSVFLTLNGVVWDFGSLKSAGILVIKLSFIFMLTANLMSAFNVPSRAITASRILRLQKLLYTAALFLFLGIFFYTSSLSAVLLLLGGSILLTKLFSLS